MRRGDGWNPSGGISQAAASGPHGAAGRMRAEQPEAMASMRLAQAQWFRDRGRLAEAQALEREPLQ